MTSNSPYQAPGAEVVNPPDSDSPVLNSTPNVCTAGQSWDWIKQGFNLFKSDPGTWIGMLIVYMIIMVVLGIIPFLGSLATMILGPVFTGGFMIACAKMETKEAGVGDLFAGFQDKFGPLAILGLIYLGLLMVPLLGMFALGLGGAMLGGDPGAIENPANFQFMLLGLLVFIAVMIPIAMGMWFSPALIIFHDCSPWQAYKLSFMGCLKNIVPFLVYGIILLPLVFLAVLPVGLGLLIFGPTVLASIYQSYKMIFLE